VRGTHVAPFGNIGVQGGTESSNLLCSSKESANFRSLSRLKALYIDWGEKDQFNLLMLPSAGSAR
jgi:hypothetical protein